MLESGSITRYVADQCGLTWEVVAEAGRNEIDINREISRKAFSLPRPPENQKSVGWTQLSDGDAAVVSVTRVRNKPESELANEELDTFARVLANQNGSYQYSEFREQIRAAADIERL